MTDDGSTCGMRLHERYLREAEKLYASGDLAQAGEKYWGAVTALINAIAERRGWSHYSHRDYAEVIERLSEELKEPLGRLFASVERLHANYYHNFTS
jgi:recombinational DNA repair protein (RecF pathway)